MRYTPSRLTCPVLLMVLYLVALSTGNAQSTSSLQINASSTTGSINLEVDLIKDSRVRDIVRIIYQKLAPVQGYTAQAESSGLDPNGGFDSFKDDIAFFRPDRLKINRIVVSGHNPEAAGSRVTILCAEDWSYSRVERPAPNANQRKMVEEEIREGMKAPGTNKLTPKEIEEAIDHIVGPTPDPLYSKVNIKAVAQAGGPTIREYLASLNNLLDPFCLYDLKTLKLERETPTEWIMLAEYKTKDSYAPFIQLTIDRTTGFLKKAECDIKELGRTQVLFNAKNVTPMEHFGDTIFKMEIPESAQVMDQTDSYLMSIEMHKGEKSDSFKDK